MRRLALAICLLTAAHLHADEADRAVHLTDVLHRAGERVERFFARAQSIVCLEVVRLQSLSSGWSSEGLGRTVESELRVSWEPENDGRAATEAHTLRRLLKVNGREPRKNDWNNCTAPEQQSREPQPLSLLLPGQRPDYSFALAGQARLDGRAAIMVDYRLLEEASVESQVVEGRDDCISFELEGGLRGRLWIDAETYDVLRLDQRLSGMVEIPLPREVTRRAGSPRSWTMERWDTSIRFKAVTFENPDETLVLPASLSSLRVTRGSGTPRLRTNTDYKNYQRFLTSGRVVGE
ncbi:MAG TPA: hypothetical protein VMO26_03315 [Vicinamibacterales bacterium]|nr:hypothetical protein [Vicinamibacterales bacterium]